MTRRAVMAFAVAFAAFSASAGCGQDGTVAGNAGPADGDAADAGTVDGPAADAPTADVGAPDTLTADAGPTALHVLFIGNSYTYVNDLPGMLATIAATAGTPPTITTDEVVQGGASLEVDWDNGLAQPKILERQWTHVVLQGQSVEPLTALGPSTFFSYAQQFSDLIVGAGAQPTLFVTWARAAGDPIYSPLPYGSFVCPAEMQDELTIAYEKVAQLWPRSILACAGEAFQRSLTRFPGIVLQQSDLSHPTVAGTYLAASTFYVALTGKPVPAQSDVPAGLSAEDAANLRDVAQVGSDCAAVELKGAIASNFPGSTDGGTPFDFGTAGFPISTQFELTNTGGALVGLTDGMSLAPPFVWTAGGGYPGGSGAGFCSSSLAPGSTCTVSVTYTAASSASGALTLDFTGAYLPSAICALRGTATQRAFLTVSDDPGLFGCRDDNCAPSAVYASPGGTAPLSLFVMNRGAVPVTSLGPGTPLGPPFAWGGGAFPGGVGSVIVGSPGTSYPYCSTGTLGVGEQCAVTVAFSPASVATYAGALNLAYSDAMGPALPNANRNLDGECSDPRPP